MRILLAGSIMPAMREAAPWDQYGQHALDFAARAGLPLKARTAEPIPLSALKAFVAPRPPHTVMSTVKLTAATGASPRPWQDALNEYLERKLSGSSMPDSRLKRVLS